MLEAVGPGRAAYDDLRHVPGQPRACEALLDRACRPGAPARPRVLVREPDDVGLQLLELAAGGVALGGELFLERCVPLDRDPHQPDDHVAEVNRLAALRARLGLVELRDQGADRRDGPEPLQAAAQPEDRLDPDARVVGDVAEGDDEADPRPLDRRAEGEVPYPAAVGGDPVADPERQHECADRRGGEHGLRHRLGRRLVGRVGELVRGFLVPRDVGCEDDHLDRRRRERIRQLDRLEQPLRDRRRQRIVVEAGQRQLPEPLRGEDVARLEAERELLQRVEPVERGHRSGQRARRGAVDAADPRPQRAAAQPPQEPELEQDAVHASARQHDRDISVAHVHIVTTHSAGDTTHPSNLCPWNRRSRGAGR